MLPLKVTDRDLVNKFDEYQSIFEHYGLGDSLKSINENENIDRYLLKVQKNLIQINENKKEKKINAKTTKKNKVKSNSAVCYDQ